MPQMQRAKDFIQRNKLGGILGVIILKAGIVALNFALIFLAARLLDARDFGIYSIVFSAAGLCCVSATLGQEMLVMRSYGEYSGAGRAGLLKGSLLFSGALTVIGAVVVAFGFLVWLGLTRNDLLVFSAVAFVALQTLVLVSSHLLRSSVGVGVGDGHANITATVFPVVYLTVCLVAGYETSLGMVFVFYAIGVAAALAFHARALIGVLRKGIPAGTVAEYEPAIWRGRSIKLWLSSTLEASNQYLDVLIIGLLLNPTAAGAYFVITRLANIFATAADAINMFSTRHIPELFFQNRTEELGRLLDSVAATIALVLIAGLVLISGGGAFVLEAFNPVYGQYFIALLVLSLGTATLAGAGPAGSMLMLTGHEGRYLTILATAIAIRAIGFLLLIPQFDLLGAVFATSISFLFTAVALYRSTSEEVGLNCSVFRLARLRVRHA